MEHMLSARATVRIETTKRLSVIAVEMGDDESIDDFADRVAGAIRDAS